VSDVFAASLWAADYLLLLASMGYAGVNLHGGTAKSVGNSLGGHLPGDDLVGNAQSTHPRPYYTPIAEMDGRYVPEPVYFGMSFAQRFAGASLFPIEFHPGAVDATAYAAKLPNGQQIVAIINKDATQDLVIDLPGFALDTVLTAPSLESRTAELTQPASYREASTVRRGSAVLLRSVRG
jgi:hypothetical protein